MITINIITIKAYHKRLTQNPISQQVKENKPCTSKRQVKMKQSAEVVPYPVPKVKNKKYIWPLLGFQNAYFFFANFF